MKDSLTHENWRDFGPRYVDTYAFYQTSPEKKPTLVYITNSDEHSVSFQMTKGGFEYNAKRDSGTFFEFIQVDKQWVLGRSGKPYLMQRVPARQWRRGISRNNTSILSYNPKMGLDMEGVNFSTLGDIYCNEAKKEVCEFADVLSKHFLAVYDGPLLFYREPVGKVITKDTRRIIQLPSDSMVTQEVVDVLRRTGKDKDYTLEVTNV